jgi:hypothetical protein
MKIDRIYIPCFKKDFYFTKICVASIRYWNKEIPISLIKDFSKGAFDSSELEKTFDVSVFPLKFSKMDAYGKLAPFIDEAGSRILLMDSDIIWIKDMIPELNNYAEDIVVQCYNPQDKENEMNCWYFNTDNLKKFYSDYTYPGFLFNTGQMVVNTSAFSEHDFKDIIEWKEQARPIHKNTFLCEDQGIINYVAARKIKEGKLSFSNHLFYIHGFDLCINQFRPEDKNLPGEYPGMIHWHGNKPGIIFGLPGHKMLNFYEKYYYSKIKSGVSRRLMERIKRTCSHPWPFTKNLIKKMIGR